jgi:hypothetical protein
VRTKVQSTPQDRLRSTAQVQPELTFRALSHLLIVFLSPNPCRLHVDLHVERNRFGWPLRGIVWFYLVIVGSCAVIALAGYAQRTRSIERVTNRVEAVTFEVD